MESNTEEFNDAGSNVEFESDGDAGELILTPDNLPGYDEDRVPNEQEGEGDDDDTDETDDETDDDEDAEESDEDGDEADDDEDGEGDDDDEEESPRQPAGRKPEELTAAELRQLRDTKDIRVLRRAAVAGAELREALGNAWLPTVEKLKNYRSPKFATALVDFADAISDEDVDPEVLEERAVALNKMGFDRFNQYLADKFAEDYVLDKYADTLGVPRDEIARRLKGEIEPSRKAPAKVSHTLEAQLAEWAESTDPAYKRMADEVKRHIEENAEHRQYRQQRELADQRRAERENARTTINLKNQFLGLIEKQAEEVLKHAEIRPGKSPESKESVRYHDLVARLMTDFRKNEECLKIATKAEKVFIADEGALTDLKLSAVRGMFANLLTDRLALERKWASKDGKKPAKDGNGQKSAGNGRKAIDDRVPTRDRAIERRAPEARGGKSKPYRALPDPKKAKSFDQQIDAIVARADAKYEARHGRRRRRD